MFGIDDMALALGASAVIGAGVSAYNSYQQRKENQTMREREDNAISRRIADLQANGLSPTLSAGAPASSAGATAQRFEPSAFDRMSQALALYQGKADIAHTNSQTALNELMAGSEKFKQAFLQAQTEGENLRNNWINAEKFSEIDLRDKRGQKIGEEMKQIVENTALLKAKTAYEQENLKFLQTQHENAKINQDMLMIDRDWHNTSKTIDLVSKMPSNPVSAITKGLSSLGPLMGKFSEYVTGEGYRNHWYIPKRFVP